MKLIFALLLTSSILYSQNDSIYKFTLPELKITQLENGKDVTYGFSEERNLFLVSDTMLIADQQKYKYQVPISNIRKISILNGDNGWRGAKFMGLVGGGLGVVMGGIVAAAYGGFNDKAGLVIAIPALVLTGILTGGIVGGILGATIPYFEEYSKFSNDKDAKKEILKRIFRKHNIK